MRTWLLGVTAAALAVFFALRLIFGGGTHLGDRTTPPALPASALEVVADLDRPPGNIAVSPTGRVFFTFHPEASPPVQLAELVDGKPVPFPSPEFQTEAEGTPHFQSVLAVRIDRQNRLWVLDYAHHGRGQPRLLAFDIDTRKLVHRHDFSPKVAGFLSMLNDFQVDPEGRWIYVADTGLFRRKPGIVVYDVERRVARRLLDRHPSVMPKRYILKVHGRDMVFFGFYTLLIGVDSIALDRTGEWLYYGPVNHDRLFRIRTEHLRDESLSAKKLAAKIEDYGLKPLSDGLSTDLSENVYVTAPEHSAVLQLTPDKRLRTLVKDPRLRWPDGLSFGPDDWLYVTASSLHEVILESRENVEKHAPYQILRFRPGPAAIAGH